MNRRAWLLAAAVWLSPPVWAQAGATAEQRWKSELDAFAAADRKQMPPAGGVLFVGSSSIRMWSGLETAFADQPVVIRRGFGGSRLSDSADLVHRLVLPYQPRLVVLYAGENDLAEGASPQDLLGHFVRFVQQVQTALPATRVAYMSIKPSPSRLAHMATMREANLLIQTFVLNDDRLDYIDVHTAMLDNDGRARPELFVRDQLHLSAEGYGLWRQIVSAHLRP
ncbi:GDSL-type esterase/lipase family protein [Hydrogenophaga sp.]|uniref:GDSL-type esterase/lipase family protein n=1 Tax=Hydrogenophaga sp. TaxID=1904254 RepID=UPI00272F8AFA|nr:GDSL-type esterase/lipase family protein [Hydrogenophaga sp.]MDP2016278.1 GDSL-type esterase/lipase family protein [Hydrogenophaga sp.]MDP3165042.1 GDSL-type esterase/lipase family protein [Hydrogenophaga sp.]